MRASKQTILLNDVMGHNRRFCPIWPCRLCSRSRTLAFAYSITSSARPSKGSGILRPSVAAVFRLMISSTFTDC